MFDPTVENPIPLAHVPLLSWLPCRRHGKRLNVATVFRWVRPGLRGVRLETIRYGGTLCTSEAALKRFFMALTVADPLCAPAAAVCKRIAQRVWSFIKEGYGFTVEKLAKGTTDSLTKRP